MTISEAAILRGPSGFLHPVHIWTVEATKDGNTETIMLTTNARDAKRGFARTVKYASDTIGRLSGASVKMSRDGATQAEYQPIRP